MLTVSWDMKGSIIIDFLEKGETINNASYCQPLWKNHLIYWMTHHIYIYIYIYIYCLPQTDRFVGSRLFSVAWHARCFKLRSKHWLYVSQISYPRDIVILSVSKGIFYRYIYLHLHFSSTGVLNSWVELYIYAYVVTGNSSPEWSNKPL